METHSDTRMLLLGGAVVLVSAALLAVAAVEHDAEAPPAPAQAAPAASAVAPSYAELRNTRRGPNGWMYQDVSVGLSGRLPEEDEPVLRTEAEWDEAVAARRERRAYDGAPPRVPHAVTQQTQDCVSCHVDGGVIAGKAAPKLSHPMYPSCTQCHVPMDDPRPDAVHGVPPLTDNTFVGLEGPRRGERAWPGAPPTIPHTTRMRDDCTSCHGTSGKLGLRTPHLDRRSCTQCHAPSAMLDQRPPWMREKARAP
jgi:cytochrome c-type protein NapB